MLCQKCNEHEARVHLTQIIGDEMSAVHFCEICGKDYIHAAEHDSWSEVEWPFPSDTERILNKIMARDIRYPKEAYQFVQDGVARAMKSFWKPGMRGHLSGTQLLESLRELAVESFGKRARAELNRWGIFKCEDFGEIVFNLVEARLLTHQEVDMKADFRGGYNFDTAFPL